MGTSPSLSLHREGKGLAVLKVVQSSCSQAHWWQALQGRGSFRGGDEETQRHSVALPEPLW